MKTSSILSFALSLCSFISLDLASAIVIDEFNDVNPSSVSTLNPSSSSSGMPAKALGAGRSVSVIKSGGAGSIEFSISGSGQAFHSQQVGTAGRSSIIWDGDQISGINPSGLGGIDLLQDGATAFQIAVTDFDAPSSTPQITFSVTIFDSRDSSGTTFSTAAVVFSDNNGVVNIPFSIFNNPEILSNLGAILLVIDGQASPAADIAVDWFVTNGKCALIPDTNGRVIDQCGVCGGDNSSCADCSGVPNGNSVIDRCDVCNGDGMSCIKCDEVDFSGIQTTLDSLSKTQERIVRNLLLELIRLKPTPINKNFINQAKVRAHKLQITNWTLSWTMPSRQSLCTKGAQFCATASSAKILSDYRNNSKELLSLSADAFRRILKIQRKPSKKVVDNYAKAKIIYNQSIALSYQMPEENLFCN